MTGKICPLVNGKCIGMQCMACEDYKRADINGFIVHWEKYYTCKILGIEVDIEENKECIDMN